MTLHTLQVAAGTLTRVGYVDVSIPAETAGLEASQLASVAWAAPIWTDGDKLRAGAAAWCADLSGTRVVFDPIQAADDVLRANPTVESAQQAAIAQRFESAGFPRESVDLVVLSHIEGVGMVGWRDAAGAWSPFFPAAKILVSDVALRTFHATAPTPEGALQREAWSALIDQGAVDCYSDGERIAPGLRAAVTGGHCAGHALLHFGEDADRPQVSMIGHLAISPLHLATGECQAQHDDAALAWSLLRAAASDGRTLIGPLWPTPGFGRWIADGFEAGA